MDAIGRGKGFLLAGSQDIQPSPIPSSQPRTEATPASQLDAAGISPHVPDVKMNKSAYIDSLLTATLNEATSTEEQAMSDFAKRIDEAAAVGEVLAKRSKENEDEEIDPIFLRAAEGQFEMRDKVGQRWEKYKNSNPEFVLDYSKKIMKDKKKAREEWAKAEFSWVLAKKRHSMSWREVDRTKGEYMTLGQLVQSYGGWQWAPAIQAAQRHALKCATMGGVWFKKDEAFSGLMLFLKYTQTQEFINEQSWSRLLEYDENEQREPAKLAALSSSSSTPAATTPAAIKDIPKSKAKAKGKAKNEAKTDASPGKAGSGDIKEVLKEANSVKVGLQKTLAKADQLLHLIQHDPAYDDLKNAQNYDKLLAMTKQLREGMTQWQKKFMLEDIKTVRAANTQAQLETELKQFSKIDVEAIKDFVEQMLRRHFA